MSVVGFDSIVLEKPILESQVPVETDIPYAELKSKKILAKGPFEREFKAMVGASVTTEDEEGLRQAYNAALRDGLKKFNINQLKPVYSAAHLVTQTLDRAPTLILTVLEQLASEISRICIYCAYYNRPFVSQFGEGQGERLLPIAFIEKNKNAFPHVCAWHYWSEYNQEPNPILQIDHFNGKLTPSWRNLTSSVSERMQIYYSGDECNALIATADIILRLVKAFHYGKVDGVSLLNPIKNRCSSLSEKLRFHNLGASPEDQRLTAPVVDIPIDTGPYIKRPVFYLVAKRRPSQIEWTLGYNRVMERAYEQKGCVKILDLESPRDRLAWDVSKDYLVPYAEEDMKEVEALKSYGYPIPKVLAQSEKI